MSQTEHEQCPYCDFPIYDDEALSCPMCGRVLNRGTGFIGGLTRGGTRWLGILSALLVLLGFLWWLF